MTVLRASARTARRTVIAAVVVTLGLAGCGGSDADETQGCGAQAIAFIGPTTGPDGGFVRTARNGAELAVRRHNVGNADCPVGLITFDTTGDAGEIDRVVDEVVGDPQILGVVGPTFSGLTADLMPAFDRAGLTVVSGSATNPGLADEGWSAFHRVVGTDAAVAPADVTFLVDRLEARRVAVIDDEGLYGVGLADLAADGLRDRDIAVPVRSGVDPESVNYSSTVAAVLRADADAVFFGGLSVPGARLVRQLREAGFRGDFVGGDGVYQDEFITAGGAAAVGAYGSCPCLDATGGSPERVAFALEYADVYGSVPGAFAAEYYDSADVILRAIADGATSRSAVEQWVTDADVSGLTKRIRFEPNGNIRGGPIYIYRVSEARRFVPAATVVDGKLVGR